MVPLPRLPLAARGAPSQIQAVLCERRTETTRRRLCPQVGRGMLPRQAFAVVNADARKTCRWANP